MTERKDGETTYPLDFTVSPSAVCVRCGRNYADVAVHAANGSKDAVCRPCVRVKGGEVGGRYPRIARGYTQCPHGATWYCEICNANEPEPRIIAECWTCCGNQEHIRKPHAEWPMCSHLKVEGYSERYCRAAGHDVRAVEVKP